jgi:DNA polymerase-3 subunit gamma/tau
MRDAWPEVLARLETLSRTSWLVASGARVLSLDDDVLALGFAGPNDLAAFKKRSAGSGPSEDLRQAIMGVLGIRVKFIARLDGDGPDGRGPAAPPPAPAPAPEHRPAAAAAAPVTEWAVAPIPVSAPEPDGGGGLPGPAAATPAVAQFAVDDEPEDAAPDAARIATLAPAREGDVLPADVVEPSADPDEPEDELPPDEPVDAPVPPVVAPPIAPARGGVQRYGEAVVRQVLGARFVREEPHQSPTRFS